MGKGRLSAEVLLLGGRRFRSTLKRRCRKCDAMFVPLSRYNRVCKRCKSEHVMIFGNFWLCKVRN